MNYVNIGTFHNLKVAKSISGTVISCWPSEWPYKSIYTPTCFNHVSGIMGLVYARGVMVIVAGYGHSDTSSNPGRD